MRYFDGGESLMTTILFVLWILGAIFIVYFKGIGSFTIKNGDQAWFIGFFWMLLLLVIPDNSRIFFSDFIKRHKTTRQFAISLCAVIWLLVLGFFIAWHGLHPESYPLKTNLNKFIAFVIWFVCGSGAGYILQVDDNDEERTQH